MIDTAPELLGNSVVMRQLRDEIARVAHLDVTVLIEGEDGTGKRRVARVIHDASRRRDGPFVSLTCANLEPLSAASAFFGHRPGAFDGAMVDRIGVFEAADRGTLLLDQIGRMPPEVQGQLLRVLEEQLVRPLGDMDDRQVDVRVLATTDRNLEAGVRTRCFRQDLLYRIGIVRLHLPRLESRREDIPLLADTFVREACRDHGLQIDTISADAVQHLMARNWLSNVVQLKATIDAAVLRSTSSVLELKDFLPDS